MKRLAVLLVAVLAFTGCTRSFVPTSDPGTRRTAAALGKSDWPVLGGNRPVLGVDLYALDNYSAAQVEADGRRALAYIKNVLRADAVGIVWNFYAPNLYSAIVNATDATLSAANVAILTRIAIQDHLLVEYRPLILKPSGSNHWAGLIDPYPPVEWFNSYYHAVLPYLRTAQQLGVREFVTASELEDLNTSPLWPSFFARVSRVYHGVISYSAWDGDYFGTAPGKAFQTAMPELPAGEICGHGYVLAYEPPGRCYDSGRYGGMGGRSSTRCPRQCCGERLLMRREFRRGRVPIRILRISMRTWYSQ